MLKKSQRLSRVEFDQCFKAGRRFHSPNLQCIYCPSPDFHGSAVVGKKVFKKAVDRNKQRRRIYAALYRVRCQQSLHGVYILIAKPSAKSVGYKTLSVEIVDLVGRIQKTS